MLVVILAVLLVGCAYTPEPVLPANQVKIKASDSLEVLADKYDVTVKELIEYNGIQYPYHIRVGQVLRIPEITDPKMIEQEEKNSGALIGQNAVQIKEDIEVYKPEPVVEEKERIEPEVTDLSAKIEAKRKKQKEEIVEKQISSDDIEPKKKKPKNDELKKVVKEEKSKKEEKQPIENGKTKITTKTKIQIEAEKKPVVKPKQKEEVQKTPESFRTPLEGFSNITLNPKSKRLRLKAKNDSNVYAIGAGRVYVSPESYPDMGGRVVVVKHDVKGQTYLSIYGGMKDINPDILNRKKQFVKYGESIGNLGMTKDKQNVLNFELMKDNMQIHPSTLIAGLKALNKKK